MSKKIIFSALIVTTVGGPWLAHKGTTTVLPILEAKRDFDAINAANVTLATLKPPVLTDNSYSNFIQGLCGQGVNAKSISCSFRTAQQHAETHGTPVTLTYTICPTQDATESIKKEYRIMSPECQ